LTILPEPGRKPVTCGDTNAFTPLCPIRARIPLPDSKLPAQQQRTFTGQDDALSVAVSPPNGTVFVTGASESPTSLDYATIAYHRYTPATC
jgi:hypothetical protein